VKRPKPTSSLRMGDSDSDYSTEYTPEDYIFPATARHPLLTITAQTVVPPPPEFLLNLRLKNEEISGRRLWAGSVVLGCYLRAQYEPLSSKQTDICELGCGSGVLGMMLSKTLSPSSDISLCLTDNDSVALDLCRENLQLNSLNYLTVGNYAWGEDTSAENDGCCIKGSKFDVVIAGDVMYKEGLPELFFKAASDILVPDGVMYICHVPRYTVTHDVVVRAAGEAGFVIETVAEGNDVVCEDVKEVSVPRRRRFGIAFWTNKE